MSSIFGGALEPDLSLRPRQRADVPHLEHRRREGAAERRPAGREVPDRVVGAAAVEELLVGVQEALLRQQVAVVGVVEGVGRRGVQRRHDVGPAARRAGCLERRRERRVDVGVVVDVGLVARAARLPDRVRACVVTINLSITRSILHAVSFSGCV
jgi:hypothetical protein